MRHLKTILVCGSAMICFSSAYSQFGIGNRVANRILNQKVDEAIDGKNKNNKNNKNNQNNETNEPANNSNGKVNQGQMSEGLKSTAPDVKANLVTAEATFKAGKYSEARYAVQQAMLGVELEIGQKILKSFPLSLADISKKTTDSLKADTLQDQLTSSGWGWQGLTMKREFLGQKDKQLILTIANNLLWMQGINLYFDNMQSTGGQTKAKKTSFKGLRAIIEYDDSRGYKLSVPLGQTSLAIFDGMNFKNEEDFMFAANQINLNDVKTNLGEN
jgi:hypothetical protein